MRIEARNGRIVFLSELKYQDETSVSMTADVRTDGRLANIDVDYELGDASFKALTLDQEQSIEGLLETLGAFAVIAPIDIRQGTQLYWWEDLQALFNSFEDKLPSVGFRVDEDSRHEAIGTVSIYNDSYIYFDIDIGFEVAIEGQSAIARMSGYQLYHVASGLPFGGNILVWGSYPEGEFDFRLTSDCTLTRLSSVTQSPTTDSPGLDARERLELVKDLLGKGLITEAEAEEKRRDILKDL